MKFLGALTLLIGLLVGAPAFAQFNGTNGIFALNHMTFGVMATPTLVAGGSGYSVGDVVTLDCPNTTFFTSRPTVTITSVSSGAVTAFGLSSSGLATGIPSTGLAGGLNGVCTLTQFSTTGSGTGLRVQATFGFNAAGGNLQPVNNVDFLGADPTGATDSTTYINIALALPGCTYLPAGNYYVTNALNAPATNGCIFGDGRTRSVIWAYNSRAGFTNFNLSASGVLVLPNNTGNTATQVRDLGFDFVQPQTNVRANIVAFPPAIYAQGAARMQLTNIRVSDSNVCLDARGNDGGAFITDFECGALTAGMYWDGALDTVHWKDFHFWNFGAQLAGGQLLNSVYHDGNTICFTNGRIDDLSTKGTSCESGNITFTTNANTGGLQQNFEGLYVDNGASLTVQGGDIRLTNSYVAGGTLTAPMLSVTGGSLLANQFRFGYTLSGSVGISISGGKALFSDSFINCTGDGSHSCATVSNGVLSIKDSVMGPQGASAWSGANAFISQSGGALIFDNNYFASNANGAGFYYAAANALNDNVNNKMNGWTSPLPAIDGSSTCTTPTSIAGNSRTGRMVAAGTSASCTIILDFATAGLQGDTGMACEMWDQGTPADLINQTSSTVNSATMTGAMQNTDTLKYLCTPY